MLVDLGLASWASKRQDEYEVVMGGFRRDGKVQDSCGKDPGCVNGTLPGRGPCN